MAIIIPRPPAPIAGGGSLQDIFLQVNVALTEEFVSQDPSEIAIIRSTKVPDGSGGYVLERSSLAAQTVRMIPRQDSLPIVPADGAILRSEYVLVGVPTINVARLDLFDWHGARWRVEAVHKGPAYIFKADVVIFHG